MEVEDPSEMKERPDYSYKSYDKTIKNATKPLKSHQIVLSEPHDTALKLYMDQGYKPKPLEDCEIRTLSVYAFDLDCKQNPIIDVDVLIIGFKVVRMWLPKNIIPYTDWAPSISDKLLSKLYKMNWTFSEEINPIRLPRKYYTSCCKSDIVWNQKIGFEDGKFFALEREKVKILSVHPSRYVGVFTPELRVYSFRDRQQYFCNDILLTSEKEDEITLMTIAINDNHDFMDFLYFSALHSAIKVGYDITKVIESNVLPKYLNIASVWYNNIDIYAMHLSLNPSIINNDLCIYYLSLLMRKTINKHSLQSIMPQPFNLTSTVYNIEKYGLTTPPVVSEKIIEYCMSKEINVTYNEKEIVLKVMTSEPDQIQYLNIPNPISYTGYSKLIVSPFCTIKYVRKYEAFIVSSISLRQTRN
eukprot:11673_1